MTKSVRLYQVRVRSPAEYGEQSTSMLTDRQAFMQVDAFATKRFSGNPAAVCIQDDDIPDNIMQQIAAEMNLSETAFVRRLPSSTGGWVFCTVVCAGSATVQLIEHTLPLSAGYYSGTCECREDLVMFVESNIRPLLIMPDSSQWHLACSLMPQAGVSTMLYAGYTASDGSHQQLRSRCAVMRL